MNNEKNELKYYVILDRKDNSALDIKEFDNFNDALGETVSATDDDRNWALLFYKGDNFIWSITRENGYGEGWILPIVILLVFMIVILIMIL